MLERFLAKPAKSSVPLIPLRTGQRKAYLATRPRAEARWIESLDFVAQQGNVLCVPGPEGGIARVLVGIGDGFSPWSFAGLPERLPPGKYHVEASKLGSDEQTLAALGWALGCYRFDRYKSKPRVRNSQFAWPPLADRAHVEAVIPAIGLGRDLINTPAEDMGPPQLAEMAKAVAKSYGATYREVVGNDLLTKNYPLIHAVGRASTRDPRLVELRWGSKHAHRVTLVGKGVCFDSGGMDLKTGGSMKMMKKDMGGAATVLALAQAIMAQDLAINLRVLIPCVENMVSGGALRPLDVIRSRKGLTVEIGNTDAEGRLILADALDDACGDAPELIIDVATLTGAARVALGAELPALFASEASIARDIIACGDPIQDPLWHMPLHQPYRSSLDSKVADLNNISSGPYGGAITAALFLQAFVDPKIAWIHIDSMAWYSNGLPGRPVGGEVMGMRALESYLRKRYGRATTGATHGSTSGVASGAKTKRPKSAR